MSIQKPFMQRERRNAQLCFDAWFHTKPPGRQVKRAWCEV